mmetsp:Transcript_35481/g.113254  ORF Transcript_35481/g.113254 Transcript_35481/m.113254 type:complete len:237 (-) Transcript_35481:1-711(-)
MGLQVGKRELSLSRKPRQEHVKLGDQYRKQRSLPVQHILDCIDAVLQFGGRPLSENRKHEAHNGHDDFVQHGQHQSSGLGIVRHTRHELHQRIECGPSHPRHQCISQEVILRWIDHVQHSSPQRGRLRAEPQALHTGGIGHAQILREGFVPAVGEGGASGMFRTGLPHIHPRGNRTPSRHHHKRQREHEPAWKTCPRLWPRQSAKPAITSDHAHQVQADGCEWPNGDMNPALEPRP